MDPFFHLVERRIAQAEQAGCFRDLDGRGRPLALEDLSAVPDELRAGYILLKSHGFVPPELEARKQWLRLADLLAACVDPDDREPLRRKVARARERYEAMLEARTGRPVLRAP